MDQNLKTFYSIELEDRLKNFPLEIQDAQGSGKTIRQLTSDFLVKINEMGLHGKLITFKNVNNTLSGLATIFINRFNVQERLNKPFGKNFKDGISSITKTIFTERTASDFYINLESLKQWFFRIISIFIMKNILIFNCFYSRCESKSHRFSGACS